VEVVTRQDPRTSNIMALASDPPIPAPHGAAFVDRAQQMVAFLARHDRASADAGQRPEAALAEWIAHWRGMPVRGLDATQHFVAEELGIIVRALNGPAETRRVRDERTDDLCWLIARCISHGA
jgi:hypothetical protein